ncbi:hypothetical protein Esti_003956 [Eimeria stiedai]
MSSTPDSPVADGPLVREASLSKPALLKKPPVKPPPAKASGVRAADGKTVLPMSPAKTLGGSAALAKTKRGGAPVPMGFLKRAPVGPGPLPKRAPSADAREAPTPSTPREEGENEAVDSEPPSHDEEKVFEEVEEATRELHADLENVAGSASAHESPRSRVVTSNIDESIDNVFEENELLTAHEAAAASPSDDNSSRIQSDVEEHWEADSHEAQDAPSSLAEGELESAEGWPPLSVEGETRAAPTPGHQETLDTSTTYSADTLPSATVSKPAKGKLLDSIDSEGGEPPPGCTCCCCRQQKLQAVGVTYAPGLPPPSLPFSSSYPSRTRTSVFAAPQMHAPGSFAWTPYSYPLPPVQSAHFAPAAHPLSSNSGMDVELRLNVTSGRETTGDAGDLSSESDLGDESHSSWERACVLVFSHLFYNVKKKDFDHRWGMTKDDPRWAKVNYEERLKPAPPLVSARHVTNGPQSSGIAGPVYRTVYTRPKNYKMGNTYCKHYQLPTVASLLRAGMPEFLRKRPIKIMTEGPARTLQLDGALKFEVEFNIEAEACNSCNHSPGCQGPHPELHACCSTEALDSIPTGAAASVCSHGCFNSPMHAHSDAWQAAAVGGAPHASSCQLQRAPVGYGGSSGGVAPVLLCEGAPPPPSQYMGPRSYGGCSWQMPVGGGSVEVHPGISTAHVDSAGSSLWPTPFSHAHFAVDHSGRAEGEARDQWCPLHPNSCHLSRPSFSEAAPLPPAPWREGAQGAPVRLVPLCSREAPGLLNREALERDIHTIGARGSSKGNNNSGMQGTFKRWLRLPVSPPAKRLW